MSYKCPRCSYTSAFKSSVESHIRNSHSYGASSGFSTYSSPSYGSGAGDVLDAVTNVIVTETILDSLSGAGDAVADCASAVVDACTSTFDSF